MGRFFSGVRAVEISGGAFILLGRLWLLSSSDFSYGLVSAGFIVCYRLYFLNGIKADSMGCEGSVCVDHGPSKAGRCFLLLGCAVSC